MLRRTLSSAKKRGKAGTSKALAADRKRRWVEAMLTNGGNQTQAAVAAGIAPGFAAEKYGYRMSKDVQAHGLLQKRLAERIEKAKLTADEVLMDLAEAMRFDPADLYDEDGSLKKVRDMPPHLRRHLEGNEVKQRTIGKESKVVTSKVKYPNKKETREQAMRHFGLFEKDNRQKPPLPPIEIKFV